MGWVQAMESGLGGSSWPGDGGVSGALTKLTRSGMLKENKLRKCLYYKYYRELSNYFDMERT